MRRPAQVRPIQVSTALFMDLAFLLIAALVLLAQDPSKLNNLEQAPRDLSVVQVRSTYTPELIEKEIPGESLFVSIRSDGSLQEELSDGTSRPFNSSELRERMAEMPKDGERVVVLMVDKDLRYTQVAHVRDILSSLVREGRVTRVYETVQETP